MSSENGTGDPFLTLFLPILCCQCLIQIVLYCLILQFVYEKIPIKRSSPCPRAEGTLFRFVYLYIFLQNVNIDLLCAPVAACVVAFHKEVNEDTSVEKRCSRIGCDSVAVNVFSVGGNDVKLRSVRDY